MTRALPIIRIVLQRNLCLHKPTYLGYINYCLFLLYTSAWDAIEALTQAAVEEPLIARMLGGNAAAQFDIPLTRHVSG